MGISTFWYCLKQGLINIGRNIWFSLASTAIISACIFLFCIFFSLMTNVQYMVTSAESTMGITVFFDENLFRDQILSIGDQIRAEKEELIKDMRFVSADEAWETFQKEYFGDNASLAEGFAEDNPLAGSASYEIFLHDIGDQAAMVEYLEAVQGVRKVNYSDSAMAGLSSFNTILTMLFGVLIAILLAVAVFLISNTIQTAAAFRKSENQIMRLIGATNFMIRAPFVVEGTVLGLVGAAVPLGMVYVLYSRVVDFVGERFALLSNLLQFLPIDAFYPQMAGISLALGGGLGFVVSFMTIRKHLRV